MSSKENFGCGCGGGGGRLKTRRNYVKSNTSGTESFECACDYYSKEEMAYANPTPGGRYIIDTCCKSSERFFNQG